VRGDRVGVGDIDEVSDGAGASGDTSGGDDGRGAGQQRDARLVSGCGRAEHGTQEQPCRDRIGVSDGAWIKHGAGIVHGAGAGGADGVRGDRVGVGDIDEVSDGAGASGDTSGGDDGRGAGQQRDARLVSGCGRAQHGTQEQPCRDRIGVSDGAWIKHGAGIVHGAGAGGADGVRGDRVGVGDIDEVSDGAGASGDTSGGDDGRGAGQQRDARLVSGCVRAEHGTQEQPCRDRIGVSDGAWIKHGAGIVHGAGAGGVDGMRGDRVGVGDIDEVSDGAGASGDTSGGDDGRGAGQQRDARLVSGCGRAEHGTQEQPCRDRIGVSDGAWIKHGAGIVHGAGAGGADGVRGDRVGVTDDREVLAASSIAWYSADTVDAGRGGQQRDARLVSGCGRAEHDTPRQPCRDRIGVSDGAWVEYGTCSIFGFSEGGSDGLRSNRLGSRDICEMQVRRRISRYSSGVRNCGRAW
jgi:hypothetical protein